MFDKINYNRRTGWSRPLWFVLTTTTGLALGCSSNSEPDKNVLVLSPYTGDSAADGFNREQALQLVSDRFDTTQVAGAKLGFVFFDSGGEATESEEFQALLSDTSTVAMVGPDDFSTLASRTGSKTPPAILNLLPGISTEVELQDSGDETLWLGPTAEEMACTLAENIYDFQDYRVAVVHDSLPLHVAMAATILETTERYDVLNRSEHLNVTLGSTAGFQAAAFASLVKFKPDAIVLLTSTVRAASLIQDWSAEEGKSVSWYLGPGLLGNELLENVPSDEIEGAVGIAPGVQTNNQAAERFRKAFEAKLGATPFPSTYYYVDAAVLAIAATQAAHAAGSASRADIIEQARQVGTSPGQRFEWDEIDTALQLLKDGEAVDYQGLTGALTIDKDGTVIRVNNFDLTRVEDSAIVSLFQDTCI